VERIPGALLEQVMALTHGHPLAVSLLIDAVHRSGSVAIFQQRLASGLIW
jgi:hypothetical protein